MTIKCTEFEYINKSDLKNCRKMGNEIVESGFGKQFQHNICGCPTEFVFEKFNNKWFLAISQFKGLPNIFTVSFDQKVMERLPSTGSDGKYSVPVLMNCNFGLDVDEVRAAIQFLINHTKLKQCPEDMVVSLGLKEVRTDVLREIVKILDEIVL